jgi:hypothetical protein
MSEAGVPESSVLTFRLGRHAFYARVAVVAFSVAVVLFSAGGMLLNLPQSSDDRSAFSTVLVVFSVTTPLFLWWLLHFSREHLAITRDRIIWQIDFKHEQIPWNEVTSVTWRSAQRLNSVWFDGTFGRRWVDLSLFDAASRDAIVQELRRRIPPGIPYLHFQAVTPVIIPLRRVRKLVLFVTVGSYVSILVCLGIPYLRGLVLPSCLLVVPSVAGVGLLDARRYRSWQLLIFSLLLIGSMALWWIWVLKPLCLPAADSG